MKMYCETTSLRLVGKAWEVRAKLKQMSRTDMTLHAWLQRQVPSRPY